MLHKKKLKFARPVKIFIVEGRREYCLTVFCAICVGITHFIIGATTMAILIYSVKTRDSHAILCSLAYQLFLAEGILSLNYVNGWTTPMRLRHRRFVHIFLQICSFTCAATGGWLIIHKKGIWTTLHGYTGMATVAMTIIGMISGLCAYFRGNCSKIIHLTCGMLSYCVASVSFCLGLYEPLFKNWAHPYIFYTLLCFVTFYTVVIVSTTLVKCVQKIKS